jgi:hypothetical protein
LLALSLKVVLAQNFTLQPSKSCNNIKKKAAQHASSAFTEFLILTALKVYRSKIRKHAGDEYIYLKKIESTTTTT